LGNYLKSFILQLPKIEGKNLESFKKLEEKFSYEDLLLFRELGQAEIDMEMETNQEYVAFQEKKKKKKSIFNFGTLGKKNVPVIEPDFFPISEKEKFGLYQKVISKKSDEIFSELKIPEDVLSFILIFDSM
jgi:hypothetical protein